MKNIGSDINQGSYAFGIGRLFKGTSTFVDNFGNTFIRGKKKGKINDNALFMGKTSELT